MIKCSVCGSQVIEINCMFDVPIEEAPWMNDYNLMARGEMEHKEHQRMVACWNLHHKDQVSKKVIEWAEEIINNYKPN
jgi:hypothetical protein